MPSILTQAQLAAFHSNGFVIVRAMFDPDETDLLRSAMEQDKEVSGHMLDRLDAQGAATRIALWNRAGDSVYGMAARCARMVDTMEQILQGPVYHFQSKLTAKEPFVGGAWEWHQDYGYWYHNGCLFPHLASCQIALDRSTTANGCLNMVAGSHLLGRIDHVPVPGEGQNVADPARMKRHPRPARGRPLRTGTRRRGVLPQQHAASVGCEPLAASPLDADLLLQPHRQRHRDQGARPLLRAAANVCRTRRSSRPACASPAARSISPAGRSFRRSHNSWNRRSATHVHCLSPPVIARSVATRQSPRVTRSGTLVTRGIAASLRSSQ